jgi:hypothetical protein
MALLLENFLNYGEYTTNFIITRPSKLNIILLSTIISQY